MRWVYIQIDLNHAEQGRHTKDKFNSALYEQLR